MTTEIPTPLKRVLVADDSRVFRALMAEVLREKGLEVFDASNGREALQTALVSRPELLILDALMPLMSGFDVITALREKAPAYSPKIFMVTAVYKSRRWETEARVQYAVDEYMEKPLEPETLLEALKKHFGVH